MQVWRLCRERYQEAAFTGEGARLFSGRWNPAGVRMVYTSTSLALATVELFVHLDSRDAPEDLVSIAASWPDDAMRPEILDVQLLPDGWQAVDHPAPQALGAAWVSSNRSAALLVPSAAVTGEWNALLNPAHPAFRHVKLHAPQPFRFDARMFRHMREAGQPRP